MQGAAVTAQRVCNSDVSAFGGRPVSTESLIDGRRNGRFQQRHCGQCRFELCFGAGEVQLGAPAGVEADPGQLPGLILVVGIAQRHRELLLQAAEHEVIARHFCCYGDLGVTQARRTCLFFGARCLDAAAYAAEEVELPERIEADIRVIQRAVRTDDGGQLVAAFASLGVTARGA